MLKVSGNAVRKHLKKLKEKQFTNRESDDIVRE
jgi:predicted ArsR family transcriptional regulator